MGFKGITSKAVTKRRVKEFSKEQGARYFMVAHDFYASFEIAVNKMLEGAVERALKNKRKTVRPIDL